ncbi:uncharacterized protein LOC130967037 [Arachis stenosperma]|uniref:uncharacterized protein LOC130967037 n=1 Tax=Arachis stenosperma TaxID=217475 RepID=UPI0025AC57DC|nr:uncharacterized protein LOC130967037 [Arachis stenosperma]
MEGSIALLKTSPVRVGDQVDEDRVFFHRMFWTFPPCIEAFRHCKPLDGNSNILPVAFALVEGENAESWSYFLSNLRRHVTPQQGILVISDRHNGIKAALESPDSGWQPPHAYRAFCIRHVAANFALTFKGQDASRWLVNAAYAKTEAEFDYWFDIMRTENPAMCDWANRMEYERWTQHKDGGRRYGHMTTNISELEGHKKPTGDVSVAETTPTGKFSLGSYRVSLRDRTCDYGYFQALHYPCCHALACCAQSRLDWATYVDEVYTMSEVFKVYEMSFSPCIPEGLWPPYDRPTVIPDPGMRRAREGRPRSTRIRNNMDEADTSRPKRCGLCRQPGHTRRVCPQRGSTSGI